MKKLPPIPDSLPYKRYEGSSFVFDTEESRREFQEARRCPGMNLDRFLKILGYTPFYNGDKK